MIDIKEIRVGNVLSDIDKDKLIVEKTEKNKICGIINNEPFDYLTSSIFPILITEDLLFKLGFSRDFCENSKKGFYMYLPNGFRIDINAYSNTLGRDYSVHIDNLCCDSVLSGDVQYLHQLQNYIYDSTKQELNIEGLL